EVALEIIRRAAGDGPLDALALGGGVALNCRMNERLRRALQPRAIFVQPGANDAGTAIGAALEASTDRGYAPPAPMTDAYLGPQFGDDEIESALQRSRLRYRRCESIARDAAERLAGGEVL